MLIIPPDISFECGDSDVKDEPDFGVNVAVTGSDDQSSDHSPPTKRLLKRFVGGNGQTTDHPDPVTATFTTKSVHMSRTTLKPSMNHFKQLNVVTTKLADF
ncbi:hypothetical protein CHS0354_040677 [Potamilus streckersoni]|uniref:Uncharacterized protein n=1 Tax=Potamilus streckersoni TaxID=2493646 RepID=A0AAE0TD80_9BIVA|nr:hypothetical protein CHS0354_040677 [Potamilus streckersoni]